MHQPTSEFLHRTDGVVDISLGVGWSGFDQTLADSISTRPPRGDASTAPSTFWIDRVLALIHRHDGSDVELASGNATHLATVAGFVVASSDYEVFADESMPLGSFVEVLTRWRAEVLATKASDGGARSDSYDDDFATCARTYASLRVFCVDLGPDAIGHLLGFPATSSYVIGEPVGRSDSRRKTNAWLLSTRDEVESKDLRRHIDWLLDAIDGTELVALTRERQAHSDVFCYWASASGHGGPEFSPSQMLRLANLQLPLVLDIYGPD
jgi:Domain of unknown function (DUF4279)